MKNLIIAAALVVIPLVAQADVTTINRYTETVCRGYRHNRVCERQTETVIETPKRRPPAAALHTMPPSTSPRYILIGPGSP